MYDTRVIFHVLFSLLQGSIASAACHHAFYRK